MSQTPLVTPWADAQSPTQSALWRLMAEEGLSPYSWSNGPHDIYAAHYFVIAVSEEFTWKVGEEYIFRSPRWQLPAHIQKVTFINEAF